MGGRNLKTNMKDSIDTNVLVHFILNEPREQADKVWKFLTESEDTHFLADIAISEAVYVFEKYYKQSRADIRYNMELFFRQFDNVLEYNRELFDMIFPYYVKHPSLSFNDIYLAFRAEKDGAEPLFTFDKNLAKGHPSVKLL